MMIDLEQFLAESGIDGVVLERWFAREWIVTRVEASAHVAEPSRGEATLRGDAMSRGDTTSRGDATSRDEMAPRARATSREGDARTEISDVDAARALFIRDLQGDFGVNDEGIDLVLHLVDQVHGLRRALAVLRDGFPAPRG